MNALLIALSFLAIGAILLRTAYATPERRELTVGSGVLALIVGGYAAWMGWTQEPAPPPENASPQTRQITIHGFAEPPSLAQRVATGDESPGEIIAKMGCGVCHQIPGVASARSGVEGPLLIGKVTATRRLNSTAYQAALHAGKVRARTDHDYIVESIVNPSAFIVPGFEQRGDVTVSGMPGHFGTTSTPAAVDKLADYLVAQDCSSASRDGLRGPPMEPFETLCGN